MRRVIIFSLAILLNGCAFGVGVSGPKEAKYTSRFGLFLDENIVGVITEYRTDSAELQKIHGYPPYLKSNVISLWGNPIERKQIDSNQEQWIYKNKRSVKRGIIIAFGIPIPLGINVGNNTTTLIFLGESLIRAISIEQSYTFCGWYMSDVDSKTGCH